MNSFSEDLTGRRSRKLLIKPCTTSVLRRIALFVNIPLLLDVVARPGEFTRGTFIGREKKRGPTRVRTGDPLHPKQVSYH